MVFMTLVPKASHDGEAMRLPQVQCSLEFIAPTSNFSMVQGLPGVSVLVMQAASPMCLCTFISSSTTVVSQLQQSQQQ